MYICVCQYLYQMYLTIPSIYCFIVIKSQCKHFHATVFYLVFVYFTSYNTISSSKGKMFLRFIISSAIKVFLKVREVTQNLKYK
jgi:hypothetical protein